MDFNRLLENSHLEEYILLLFLPAQRLKSTGFVRYVIDQLYKNVKELGIHVFDMHF